MPEFTKLLAYFSLCAILGCGIYFLATLFGLPAELREGLPTSCFLLSWLILFGQEASR